MLFRCQTVCFAAAAVLWAGVPAAAEPEGDDASVPEPVRPAPDSLSGHVMLSPRLSLLVPMGSVEDGLPQRKFTSAGLGYGVDLSYGLSRYVALQVRLDYGSFGENDSCPPGGSCSASTIAVGLGLDYHMLHGASIDPWVRAGFGYRSMTLELQWPGFDPGELKYRGIDWLHLAMGADWYASRMLGFGPYLSLDLGTYPSAPGSDVARPPGASEGNAVHTFFGTGVRVTLHPQR